MLQPLEKQAAFVVLAREASFGSPLSHSRRASLLHIHAPRYLFPPLNVAQCLARKRREIHKQCKAKIQKESKSRNKNQKRKDQKAKEGKAKSPEKPRNKEEHPEGGRKEFKEGQIAWRSLLLVAVQFRNEVCCSARTPDSILCARAALLGAMYCCQADWGFFTTTSAGTRLEIRSVSALQLNRKWSGLAVRIVYLRDFGWMWATGQRGNATKFSQGKGLRKTPRDWLKGCC